MLATILLGRIQKSDAAYSSILSVARRSPTVRRRLMACDKVMGAPVFHGKASEVSVTALASRRK